jgi:glutaminyl-peptide cyclotransferase
MRRAPGIITGRGPAVLLISIALVVSIAAPGCGGGASTASSEKPASAAERFDLNAAWELIERQVAAGQRPAGSPQLQQLGTELAPLLPEGKFEPLPGEPGIRNVVGTLKGREPAIVLGAHYDTLASPRGFVGANNGAAGTAVVIEVAKALAQAPTPAGARAVRFVLFDGEEPPHGKPEEGADFYHEGLRGSRAYARAHQDETAAMILLDYIGNRGLHLPREANSNRELWADVLDAAGEVGARPFFSAKTGPGILDDHVPFLYQGVPAVDLIDWSYPGHSLADQIGRLSKRSIGAVGETTARAIEELRR